MKYFIHDTTINRTIACETIPKLLLYLEGVCNRKFQKTRKAFMVDMEDLGHVENQNADIAFYECMATEFQMGIMRGKSTVVCNIFKAKFDAEHKEAHGD